MTKEIPDNCEETNENEHILEGNRDLISPIDSAFIHLDELFQAGKLPGTKVSRLKAKYNELNRILKEKHEVENKAFEDSKSYANILDEQKTKLDKADDFPNNSESESSKLRYQLLRHHNDISEAEEKQYQLEYKTNCLKEEKRMLQKEYERMPKQSEVDKRIDELTTFNSELQKELGQRQAEKMSLKDEYEKQNKRYLQEMEDYEEVLEKIEQAKIDFATLSSQPMQLSKEVDRLQRQKKEVEKSSNELSEKSIEQNKNLTLINKKLQDLNDEKMDTNLHMTEQFGTVDKFESECARIAKEYEYAKEQATEIMGDLTMLEMNIRHANNEKKNIHEMIMRKSREKDRVLKNLKKAEMQLKVSKDSSIHLNQLHEKVKGMMAEAETKDEASLTAKHAEIKKEVEQMKRAVASQNTLSAEEKVRVEQTIADEEKLLYIHGDIKIEVVELTRLAAIKNDERETKVRDFMKAEGRYHRANDDLKLKQTEIHDKKKKYNEILMKLKDFAVIYDVIKNERNKCVTLIQTSSQRAAEMQEGLTVFQNEIEIQCTTSALREKQLQKQRLKHTNSINIKNSIKNEVAKQQQLDNEMREKREQQEMDIDKLNLLINNGEERLVQLRKSFEKTTQSRNDRGLLLIERDEEVCIFQEKKNIQYDIRKHAYVKLTEIEEEIQFLKLQLNEENRSINVLKGIYPDKTNLEKELTTLKIQFGQCQDRKMKLEKIMVDPEDKEHVRHLNGKIPSPIEMKNRLEELEIRITEKEEALLEKELISEQIYRLTCRVNSKVNSGKEDTLTLAKKVNDYQNKLKEKTREMMAIVAELSMSQAEALKLQHEVEKKEKLVEIAYSNLEKGDAPSEDIESDWFKALQNDERRKKEDFMASEARKHIEQYELSTGVSTTCEPRPNAYIPDDALPIPRPYGVYAPFKPSEQGSNMRHFRKPQPKPIEI